MRGAAIAAMGLLTVGGAGCGSPSGADQAFEEATIRFEQNATDGDTEAVFIIKGGSEGLAELSVTAPDGREVIRFACPPPTALGMRQFRFETPEPKDRAALAADFPEGSYTLRGRMVGGAELMSTAELSHELPAVTEIVHPQEEAEDVAIERLEIRWKSVPGVAGYVLEVDQEETATNLLVRLPATASSFVMPEGFLGPGLEYQLGIGTLTEEENLSVVETTFTTADSD